MSPKAFNESTIGDFFKDKSVLITGATGLVGKVIAFKILLSIASVKNVYLLIRDKRNQTFEERFTDLITKSRGLFSHIDANTLKKLVPIKGDASIIGLGLSETDRHTLINDVSIVFHSAANITFEADLKGQTLTNVGGTKEVIELCKVLKNCGAFVHVSTAYSNPLQLVVEEKIYKSHQNPIELLEKARQTEEKMKSEDYLGGFPNTYTFTKNLAENLVNLEVKESKIRAAIVRPGVVSPSYCDPVTGWVDSLNGISGVVLMAGVGLGRVARADLDGTTDPIPVDIVANTCIAAAWAAAKQKKSEIIVYNCNSSSLGAPTFRNIQHIAYNISDKSPMLKTIRPLAKPVNEFWMLPIVYQFIRFFSETCFAYLCDFGLLCIGQKRFVAKIMNRFHKTVDAMQCFIGRKWYFTNNNFIQLSQDLTGIDKILFDCDVRPIDWTEYINSIYFASRKIFLKEKEGDVEKARVRMKYLKIVYTVINYLLLLLCWYLFTRFTPIGIWFQDLYSHHKIDLRSFGYYTTLTAGLIQVFITIFA